MQAFLFDRRLISNFDYFLLALTLILCSIGIINIYSTTVDLTNSRQANLYVKQIYWMLIGLAFMVLFFLVSYRKIAAFIYPVYGLNLCFLFYLAFIQKTRGVHRWASVAGFRFQPSEFMKIILIITLAYFFSNRKDRSPRLSDLAAAGLITAAPLLLIVKQPDLGTAIVLVPVFMAMVLVASVRAKHIAGLVGLGTATLPILWYNLKPYQIIRLKTFLNPDSDPFNSGYHLLQSKIAVGSGGIWGKGFMMGTQNRLHFLPAQHTDFAFSVLAEEWGFLGATVTLVLFLALITRGMDIAAHTRDPLGRILAVGLCTNLLVHVFINVGMISGLMPVTGLPLPLLSYGGSSVISTMIGLGLLFNIRMRRFV